MKTLTLTIAEPWFSMIRDGKKKEEYREIKAKYFEMFCDHLNVYEINKSNNFDVSFHLKWPEELDYDTLVFTLGYPKAGDTERRLVFKNPKIRIGTGKPEWGAEHGKLYFVISWEAA
jgi:hypothetical protein